jgi:hypothetical protein
LWFELVLLWNSDGAKLDFVEVGKLVLVERELELDDDLIIECVDGMFRLAGVVVL